MKNKNIPIIEKDPWSILRRFTAARIGLGRCGTSLPLTAHLEFKLAHAKARDAVWEPLATASVMEELQAHGIECLKLSSRVTDRAEYLRRPDRGRQLSQKSRQHITGMNPQGCDICLVMSDGLSAPAIHSAGVAFVKAFIDLIAKTNLVLAPVSLVENGRVAIADEIGHLFRSSVSVILLGERPGLSSPDSLGVYLTYTPHPGMTDESRNCISNIREGGMPVSEGVRKLAYLVESSLAAKISGVHLKDTMGRAYVPFHNTPKRLPPRS